MYFLVATLLLLVCPFVKIHPAARLRLEMCYASVKKKITPKTGEIKTYRLNNEGTGEGKRRQGKKEQPRPHRAVITSDKRLESVRLSCRWVTASQPWSGWEAPCTEADAQHLVGLPRSP